MPRGQRMNRVAKRRTILEQRESVDLLIKKIEEQSA